METKLKKRIVGLTLLLGAGLIIAPIFFSHSVNSDQLRLSSRIPEPPTKPQIITTIKNTPATPAAPQIVFEELQSVASKDEPAKPSLPASEPTKNSSENPAPQLAALDKPTPVLLTTASSPDSSKASIVPLSTMQTEDSTPPATTNSTVVANSPSTNTPKNSVDANTHAADKAPSTEATPAPSVDPATGLPVSATPSSSAATTPTASPDEDLPPPDLDEEKDTPPAPAPAPTPSTKSKSKSTVASAKPKTAKSKPAQANKTPKAANGSPTAQAWAVQLGVFSDKINAQKLMKSLQSQGYAAYVQTMKTAHGKTQTKVLVGPELRREDAQKIQEKLKSVNAAAMLIKVKG